LTIKFGPRLQTRAGKKMPDKKMPDKKMPDEKMPDEKMPDEKRPKSPDKEVKMRFRSINTGIRALCTFAFWREVQSAEKC
jgi:hypothetical protein